MTYTDLKRRRTRVAALSATALAVAALAPVGASAFRDSGGVGASGGAGDDAGTATVPGDPGDGVFPVVGKHTYGDGLGAGRDHQGQDLLADCGKRVVAAEAGRVQEREYHGAAGNYVVIDGKGQLEDAVYMHLMRRADVRKGERVEAGQTIGRVGDTGNTSACHLHFELWSDPGYYEGGKPIDPEPSLRRWDRAS